MLCVQAVDRGGHYRVSKVQVCLDTVARKARTNYGRNGGQ